MTLTNDTNSYKAFRIVLMHWIRPSIFARKYKASTKIARWWIRISGSYRGFKLYSPYSPITESFPPGIWRQTNSCIYSYNRSHILKNLTSCPHYHLRWVKQKLKNSIDTLQIKKYNDENEGIPFHVLYSQFGSEKVKKYYNAWIDDTCGCNLMPNDVIINYKEVYGSMEHIFRIMAEDTITSRTRAQVSLYIQNRLKPNSM